VIENTDKSVLISFYISIKIFIYLKIVELVRIAGLTCHKSVQHRVDIRSEREQHVHIKMGRKIWYCECVSIVSQL